MYNGFGDTLFETYVKSYSIRLNLRKIAGHESAVLFNLNDGESETMTVKFISKEDSLRIAGDLSKIPASRMKRIYDIVVYDCNSLVLDVMTGVEQTTGKIPLQPQTLISGIIWRSLTKNMH